MSVHDEKMYPKALPESARTIIKAAAEAEQIAADIMENKRLLVELDRKRHSTMEALAAFRVKPNQQSRIPAGSKTWTNFGPFFMKLPADYVKTMLEKDRAHVNSEIDRVRQCIKESIMSMQQFRPSELDPRLVEFAMREAKRVEQGKEMEFDEEDDELFSV